MSTCIGCCAFYGSMPCFGSDADKNCCSYYSTEAIFSRPFRASLIDSLVTITVLVLGILSLKTTCLQWPLSVSWTLIGVGIGTGLSALFMAIAAISFSSGSSR